MKYNPYLDFNTLDLPIYVKKFLGHKNALANIRVFDDETYIIMNYPMSDNSVKPICIKQKGSDIVVYAHETVELPDIVDSDLTDLVYTTLEHYEDLIETIYKESEIFEETMGNGITKAEVDHLISMKRRLILYQSAVTAISEVVDYIRDRKLKVLWSEITDHEYINVQIEIKQINQNVSMISEVIDVILDVSNALYSNKLNIVMKRLAVITLVISIPTLVTSFYGMNVNLPFQDHEYALIVVFLASLGLTSLALLIMQKRGYL